MEEYLSNTINRLKSKNYSNITLVFGNESCDLDSAVSSIVYSVFLEWKHRQPRLGVCNKHKCSDQRDPTSAIFIPVLNVDRQDYELKTEVVVCLKEYGIHKENLVFRDDQDFASLLHFNSSVVLVDHHVLSAKDKFLAPYVQEIIDHRPLDKSGWCYTNLVGSTIEVVGSCCTLVCKLIIEQSMALDKNYDFFKEYTACAQLLYSTIILDTVNFSEHVKKATVQDLRIICYLETILRIKNIDFERKLRLDKLVAARSDVSSLSPAQILRKDVKVLDDVFVPSFPILVKSFLELPAAVEAVTEALALRGCRIALLLGMDLTGGLHRDVAVYCPEDQDRCSKLCSHLESWSPSFDLNAESTSPYKYYTQKNLTATRKQYMPAITQFIS